MVSMALITGFSDVATKEQSQVSKKRNERGRRGCYGVALKIQTNKR